MEWKSEEGNETPLRTIKMNMNECEFIHFHVLSFVLDPNDSYHN